MLVPFVSHGPWKRRLISVDMPLLHFSFPITFIRCLYSWEFSVLDQMIAFAIPGCKVRLLVAWSITAQSSLTGHTRVAGLLGVQVLSLMVSTWFSIRSCPWRWRARVLYLCTCGTLGFPLIFGVLWGALVLCHQG